MVGAVAEALFIVGGDHVQNALIPLRLTLRNLGELIHLSPGEKMGTSVRACRHTGSAADTCGGVHGVVRGVFAHQHRVGIGGRTGVERHVATGLNDAVESGSVNHQVFDNRERVGSERLDGDDITAAEMPHTQSTSGGARQRPVGDAVDNESTGSADSFSTIAVEGNRVFPFGRQFFVQDVEHLQKRHFRNDVVDFVVNQLPTILRAFLAPNSEGEFHCVTG